MKRKEIVLIILIILAIPIVLILIFRLFINTVNFVSVNFFPHPEWEEWKIQTSPLTSAQRDLLCENFDLYAEPICAREDVYGPDFYSYIIEAFHPSLEFKRFGIGPEPSAYEEVEEKLGVFKINCGPNVKGPTGDYLVFKCEYDLRGDGRQVLSIYFTVEENTVLSIIGIVSDEY